MKVGKTKMVVPEEWSNGYSEGYNDGWNGSLEELKNFIDETNPNKDKIIEQINKMFKENN